MSESGFLEDGFRDLVKQREKLKQDAADKRKAGFKQVKALDTMDGNKLKTMWVKKDDLTIGWEQTEAKKKELAKRSMELERKKKMLELSKFEKDLGDQEKDLADMEKKLLKEGIKNIEAREKHK